MSTTKGVDMAQPKHTANSLSRFWPIVPALLLCFVLFAYFVISATSPAISDPNTNYNISGTYSISFTFNGTVNYTLTYTNTTDTYLINASNETAASPASYDWETTALPDMLVNITLNTTNSTNGSDTLLYTIYDVTIDNTGPNITLGFPQNGNTTTNADVYFNWSITDRDTNSSCTFFIDSTSNFTFYAADTSSTTLNMTNGNYDWNISCTDNAGSTGNSSVNNFDVAVPFNPRFIYPGNNSNLSGTEIINVTWGSEAESYGIQYRLAPEIFTSTGCSYFGPVWGPQTCVFDTVALDLADGNNYSLQLIVSNGTPVNVYLYNITIDNTPPNLTLHLPANNSQISSSSVTFNWTTVDSVDINVSCDFWLDNLLNQTFDSESNSTTRTMLDGAHTWFVNCSDYTGKYNTSELRNLTIDTVYPLFRGANITPTSENKLHTNASPVLNVSFNESNPDTCEYYNGSGWTVLSITPPGVDGITICTGQVNTQVDGAQLNFSFRLNDTVGNTNTTAKIINLTVDAIAPVLTTNSPVEYYKISNGVTFFVNITVNDTNNITDGENCSLFIDGNPNNLTGILNYNESTGLCSGNVTLKDISGLNPNQINFYFSVFVKDTVNNTGVNSTLIQIDNLPPSIIGKTTNYTNDVTTNVNNSVTITINLSDHSNIVSVIVGYNDRNVTLTNTTIERDVFAATTNGSALGCEDYGACSLHIYANDTWGYMNDSETLLYIIDADSPTYTNLTINTTGPVGLKEPILIYANWTDQSLESTQSTTATLYKYNDAKTAATAIDSIALNNTNSWSNFTYFPDPDEDEGENLTFYISYTDFASRTNTSANVSLIVTNSSPLAINISLLGLISGNSNETPTFNIRFGDAGKGFENTGVILSITGNNQTRNITKASFACTQNVSYQLLATEDALINFSIGTQNPFSYSFLFYNFSYTNTTNDSFIMERTNYSGTNRSVFSKNGGSFSSDTTTYKDITITNVNLINNSDIIKANVTFVEQSYWEYNCNYSGTTLSEGAYNVTLYLKDLANNTNSSNTSWFVDGYRPSFINFSIGDQWIVQDSDQLVNTINVTIDGTNVSINWTINETNMNKTNITIDKKEFYVDLSNTVTGSVIVSLEPGYHLFEIFASDIIQSISTDTTSVSATTYLNGVTNFSRIYNNISNTTRNNLNAVLTTTLANMTWYLNGTSINTNENTRLNNSISFFISFNTSDAVWNVSTSGVNGLLYNWNNTEWNLSVTNESSSFSVITGITPTYLVTLSNYEKYSWNISDVDSYSYFPTTQPSQPTNWSFNASNTSLIVLQDIEDGNDQYHLLSECDATPSSVTSFSEACYDQNDTSYTVYSPAFVGIAYGNDSGAPNVTIETPGFNQTINNSQFFLNFSVIEPQPNTTMFCNYSFMKDNVSIGSESLVPANFSLVGMKYYYSKEYRALSDGTNYSLNVTCWDLYGSSTSTNRTFTLADTTNPVINITGESSTPYTVTINVSSDEWTLFRLNYSTSNGNELSSRTNSSTHGFNDSITISGLAEESSLYYRVYACDLAENCVYHPVGGFSEWVHTTTATSRRSGGGGGGGGGMVEGMVVASHFHGWSELPAGEFKYGINEEGIAVKEIELLLDEDVLDPTFQIYSYYGKASSVPRAQPLAYQYFRIVHQGFADVVSEWMMRFAIPSEWLTNRSSGPEKVHLFRLEKGNWSEYPIEHELSVQGLEFFTADVPGFSFFVITADGVEPEIIPPSQSNTTENDGNTSTNPGSGTEDTNNGDTDKTLGSDGINVVSYTGKGLSLWWFVIPILAILVLGFGGAYVMKTREERQRKLMEVEALDPNDPLYHLQEYIMRAVMRGHSSDQIKHKLLGAGWDDIVVDEEIEKALTRRVG